MASVRSTLEAEGKLSASDGALTTIASDGAELVRKVERKLFESSPVWVLRNSNQRFFVLHRVVLFNKDQDQLQYLKS